MTEQDATRTAKWLIAKSSFAGLLMCGLHAIGVAADDVVKLVLTRDEIIAIVDLTAEMSSSTERWKNAEGWQGDWGLVKRAYAAIVFSDQLNQLAKRGA